MWDLPCFLSLFLWDTRAGFPRQVGLTWRPEGGTGVRREPANVQRRGEEGLPGA